MSNTLFVRLFPGVVNHLSGLHEELATRIPDAGRVLDLGCGNNTLLSPYRTPGRACWGCDFTTHPDLHDRDWFRPLGAEGRIPFPDNHFDLACSLMVLEHVASPRTFLSEVARVLRPGGCFVAHSINGAHYVAWLRRLFSFVPHHVTQALVRRLFGRPEVDTFPTFYRLNTAGQLHRAGRRAGLALTEIRRYPDFGYFWFSPLLARTAIRADRWLDDRRPEWGRLYFTATLHKPAPAEALRAA